jgi:hypothetical protein
MIEMELRMMGLSNKTALMLFQECGFVNIDIIDVSGDEVFPPTLCRPG